MLLRSPFKVLQGQSVLRPRRVYIYFLSANQHQRDCNFDDVLSLDKKKTFSGPAEPLGPEAL